MNIFVPALVKAVSHIKPKIDLNDPTCLQTGAGIGCAGGIIAGVVCISKNNGSGAACCFLVGALSGGCYWYLSKQVDDRTEKQYQHEKTLAEIKHGRKDKENSSKSESKPESAPKFHCPKMPAALPPVLDEIVAAAPEGFEVSFLMSALSMLGALCFSRVRAKRDGKLHAPNLQVVVKGSSGQGKGKVMDLYNNLFSAVIDHDNANYQSGQHILQTGSISTSVPKFFEILQSLKETHLFVIEPEISAVTSVLNGSSGIDYTLIRDAFDGEVVNRSTKQFSFRGKLNMNFVFTGTPNTVDRFFAGHIEDGTANRIIRCEIPECGRKLPTIKYNLLNGLDKQIETYHSQYCYSTDAQGNEQPTAIHEIDLSYVNEALDRWVDEQYDKSDHQEVRRARRPRVSTIAFHAAIVAHMLCDEPKEDEPVIRMLVVELARFVANYTMERYIYDFDKSMDGSAKDAYNPSKLMERHDKGETWQQIANSLGKSKEAVMQKVKRFKKHK